MDLSMLTQDAAAQHERNSLSSPARSSFSGWASPLLSSRKASHRHSGFGKVTSAGEVPQNSPHAMAFLQGEEQASHLQSRSEHSLASGQTSPTHKHKARYPIAHPPPTHSKKHKMHIRAKVVLQLQKCVEGSRPMPIYEVVSAAAFALKSGKSVANVCGRKDRIHREDLLILGGQQYDDSTTATGTNDSNLGSREIVGVLCKDRSLEGHARGRFEISLADGSTWEAHHHKHHGYEFESLDGAGPHTKARWIRRSAAHHLPHLPHHLHNTTRALSSDSVHSRPEETKFQFSTIDPTSRRHPVIASMTPAHIDVSDRYAVPKPGSETPELGSSAKNPATKHHATDDDLRKLILITGVWVALREGWSGNFSYSDGLDGGVSTPALASPAASSVGGAPASPRPTLQHADTAPALHRSISEASDVPTIGKRSLSRVFSMKSTVRGRSPRIFHRRSGSKDSATSGGAGTPDSRSRASSFRSTMTGSVGLGIEETGPTAIEESEEEEDEEEPPRGLQEEEREKAKKAGLPGGGGAERHDSATAESGMFGLGRFWDVVDGIKKASGFA